MIHDARTHEHKIMNSSSRKTQYSILVEIYKYYRSVECHIKIIHMTRNNPPPPRPEKKVTSHNVDKLTSPAPSQCDMLRKQDSHPTSDMLKLKTSPTET